jgi:hypothetical protein
MPASAPADNGGLLDFRVALHYPNVIVLGDTALLNVKALGCIRVGFLDRLRLGASLGGQRVAYAQNAVVIGDDMGDSVTAHVPLRAIANPVPGSK